MMEIKTNNTDIKESNEDVNIPINSVQSYAYVERIAVDKMQIRGLYLYDADNLYPQKVRTIKERSKSLSTACKTFSDFCRGEGWSDEQLNKLIVNSENDTLFDLLKFVSEEKSEIGFALHLNYDIQGRIIEINTIDFEALRLSEKNTVVWSKDWINYRKDKSVEYNLFNPDKVREQIIEAGGIHKYTGQVFYWKGTNKVYALSKFDAVLDDGQYQAEAQLFKLRNIQNDFMASGVLSYPKAIENTNEWKEAKKEIKKTTGAKNSGRLVLVGKPSGLDDKGGKMWEPFERQSVDSLFEKQNKEAVEAIYGIFRQPTILNAINPNNGWANQQELQDAFLYYNSIVEEDRKDVETTFQKIIDASIWSGSKCEILPKILITNGTNNTIDNNKTLNTNGTNNTIDNN